jgi:hypothetical protein
LATSNADNAGTKGEVAQGTSALTKPEEPKTETIPAGPVYAFIASSDPAAPINALMKMRAFQISDWNFSGLPQKRDELFEPVPAPPPAEKMADVAPATTKAEAAGTTAPAAPAVPPSKPAPADKPAESPKS